MTNAVAPLADYLSEAGLNRARVEVEVEWLLALTARTLLGAVSGTSHGRLVLCASGRSSHELRLELFALTGALTEEIRGTTTMVSLKFTASEPHPADPPSGSRLLR